MKLQMAWALLPFACPPNVPMAEEGLTGAGVVLHEGEGGHGQWLDAMRPAPPLQWGRLLQPTI